MRGIADVGSEERYKEETNVVDKRCESVLENIIYNNFLFVNNNKEVLRYFLADLS